MITMDTLYNSEQKVLYYPCGDSTLLMKFGDVISEHLGKRISYLANEIKEYNQPGIIEVIPSYCSLLICYRPEIIKYDQLVACLDKIHEKAYITDNEEKKIIEIPVLYGGETGPDLEIVAQYNNLTAEEVVKLHSEPEYYTYMLGFMPGFPYLGGMDKRIATPRLKKPRLKIPSGSVGIAGEQTGIYPLDSPGGWQIIGQTPVELYNHDKQEPILLKSGQYIKFKPISKEEFNTIKTANREKFTAYNGCNCNKDTYNIEKNKAQKGFIVKSPGFFTTVQDLGRYNYQAYGVTVSGAMDQRAAKIANLLVGNNINEATLEITLLGPVIEFKSDNIIAITGADLMPYINNIPAAMNEAIECHSGDILSFKGVRNGCRSYVGFAGGLDIPIVMGSKSTYVKAGIGGYNGRRLEKNDEIGFVHPQTFINSRHHSIYSCSQSNIDSSSIDKIVLRVILGPEDDSFTDEGIETFLNSTYTVTNESDRMGYRLEGNKINHKKDGNIISDGIAFGAIQIPSNGMPIIMMADRQTTGGYTKIANVITVDLPKLAQAKPGDKIIFSKISINEAQNLYLQELKDIENIKEKFHEKENAQVESHAKSFRITVNSKEYNVSIQEII